MSTMNTEKLYKYVIARYVHDPVRNEPRNIGVIFFDEEVTNYRVKFLNNFRSKLGNHLQDADRKMINEFRHYFSELNPSSKDAILSSIRHCSGKLQFTEVRGVVATDVDVEFNYLFETFVNEHTSNPVRRHRLKTTLKEAFMERQLIGTGKLIADREIQAGELSFKFDFSFENGKLYTIEAVDLAVQNMNDKRAQTYESALKFEKIIHSRPEGKVKPITVIQKPNELDNGSLSLLKVLENTSEVFSLSNGDAALFYKKIEGIIK